MTTKANNNPTNKYIVLFKNQSESNVETLAKVIDAKRMASAESRASCAVLTTATGQQSRVYHRLGLGVSVLNDKELKELRDDSDVEAVYTNQVRSIPPIISSTENQDTFVPTQHKEPALVFIDGMQSALNAMRNFYGVQQIVEPAPSWINSSMPLENAQSWCLSMMGLNTNYQKATGKGVKVAVLDTGIDLSHPDFKGRFTDGVNAVSFIENLSVHDKVGHGTHCAGLVGGPKASVSGKRYGVAPDVELFIGKVLNDQGLGMDDDIVEGLDWALMKGAQIISMSLGSDRYINEPYPMYYERTASRLANQGVLLVAAAGNSSERPGKLSAVGNPAACPSIFAVGAVDRYFKVADFSCAQLDEIGILDICAPGVAVHSAWTGGTFKTISGTSMATPYVAGVAALFRELYPNESIQALWNRVLRQTKSLSPKRDFGQGLVQVP